MLEADAAGRIKGAVLRLPDFYGPGVDKSFLHEAFVAATTGRTGAVSGTVDGDTMTGSLDMGEYLKATWSASRRERSSRR